MSVLMLSGDVVGYGVAVAPIGPPICYTMVKPQKSVDNLKVMGAESQRWKETAQRFRELAWRGELSPDTARRAGFTDEAMAVVSENLRLGITNLLVAQAADGKVVGLLAYGLPRQKEASINLLAVAPENLSGTPGRGQLRGIGTGLVAAVSQEFLRGGIERVNIHPLDEAAAIFWSRKGFGVCGAGGLMCLRGREAIEGLIDGCVLHPDLPDSGEVVVCGIAREVEAMRVPRAR